MMTDRLMHIYEIFPFQLQRHFAYAKSSREENNGKREERRIALASYFATILDHEEREGQRRHHFTYLHIPLPYYCPPLPSMQLTHF
jgi:hypothetical protein